MAFARVMGNSCNGGRHFSGKDTLRQEFRMERSIGSEPKSPIPSCLVSSSG